LTLEFTFKIIEKAINNWWNATILDYIQDYDEIILDHIFGLLNDLHLETNYTVDKDYNLIKK
jgi:hypothetical protein